jgi:Tol biopolymer transport system component
MSKHSGSDWGRVTLSAAVTSSAMAALLLAALVGCAESSTPEHPEGRFVYSGDPVTHSNVGGLFVIDAGGGDPRKVTAGPIRTTDDSPDWSPDGSRIVFDRAYDCATSLGVCLALWAIDAAGGSEQRLTPEDRHGVTSAYSAAWSPDGRRIAYVSYNERSNISEVWVMNADGSDRRRLTHLGDAGANGPTWAPDSRTIAFSDGFDLFTVDVEAGSPEQRLTKTPAVDETLPDWSPDGKRIAYEGASVGSGPFDELDVYLMDMDGTHVRRLSRRGDFDGAPVWSRDGSFVAYGTTPASGVGGAIVIVDANTGRRVRRVVLPSSTGGFDWTSS